MSKLITLGRASTETKTLAPACFLGTTTDTHVTSGDNACKSAFGQTARCYQQVTGASGAQIVGCGL